MMERRHTTWTHLALGRVARTRLAITTVVLCAAIAPTGAPGQALLPESAASGWKVFSEKRCADCHAVWGLGKEGGPDLGRTEHGRLTAGNLAGAMWNHIPMVYSHMQRNHLKYPTLSQEEMSDLFIFLFFVRYLDEPGHPSVGLNILREKGCVRCHPLEGPLKEGTTNPRRWGAYTNPIVWAQKMWEHAPMMEKMMQTSGIAWPQLDDADLVNIIAYLRTVGEYEAKVYLQPGSAKTGARLFVERKCGDCHYSGGEGKDLAAATLPESLTALASRMWNHSPEMTRLMREKGIERSPLTAQEMSDIIAYVISLGYEVHGGNASQGRLVYERKTCTQCHSDDGSASSTAPALAALATGASPVQLAHAMWNHGVPMVDRISEAGYVWPQIQSNEMVDLIAYFRSISASSVIAPTPVVPTPVVPTPTPVVPTPVVPTPVAPTPVAPTPVAPTPVAPTPVAPAPAVAPTPVAPAPAVAPPPIVAGAPCASNECHPGIIAGPVLHGPAECDECHILLNAQAHQFQLLSASSDLCYKCHVRKDNAMQDHEPVAIGVCTACHDQHGADNLFGPNFTGNEVCFADTIGVAAEMKPMGDGTAMPPAARSVPPVVIPGSERPATVATDVPSLPPPTKLEGTCITRECHAPIVYGEFLHGSTQQQQCANCHAVVNEQTHTFGLVAKEPELCFQCHDQPPANTKYKHGPIAVGECTTCHDPHGAPNRSMLPESGKELCFMCHAAMREHVFGAREPHKTIEEKGCISCHDPHQGNIRYQLAKDMPDLCIECHEPIHEIINTATVRHDPITADDKCINCHNPHGSDVPSILTSTQMTLCLDCHDEPMNTPSGPIVNMKAWIEQNPERHGPVRDNNCTGCHEPHGSKNFRILQHPFPRKFYSPFSLEVYQLCFECHEETIVLDERTTTLTDFRNGDKNLHFIHVNQKKGRTCRACHEIHAGTQPKRIKDFVPFGNWKYPLNFEETADGGSCLPGCHIKRAYNRLTEIAQD